MREVPPLDTTTAIEAPEHIRFEVRIAGPARRTLAYLVDLLLRSVIAVVLAIPLVLMGSAPTDWTEVSSGAMLFVMFMIEWGYYVLFESLGHGQSPGKRMLGLRVIDRHGRPATFLAIVLRNLLRAADSLPGTYCIGLIVMGSDRKFRRLGDLVAGTIVVDEARGRFAAPVRIHPPPTEQELARIPAHPDLRGADLDAIAAFLRRIGYLSPLRELELAELVAPIYARRLGVRFDDPARALALLYTRATASPEGGRMSPMERR